MFSDKLCVDRFICWGEEEGEGQQVTRCAAGSSLAPEFFFPYGAIFFTSAFDVVLLNVLVFGFKVRYFNRSVP